MGRCTQKNATLSPHLKKNETAFLDDMAASFTTKFNEWVLHGIKKAP
jgi:hypothetical protein